MAVKHTSLIFKLAYSLGLRKTKPDKMFFNNCPKCNKLARTP